MHSPFYKLKPTDSVLFFQSLRIASRQPTDLLQAVGKSLKTLHSVYWGSNYADNHLPKEEGKKIQNKLYFYHIAWKLLDSGTGTIYPDQKD